MRWGAALARHALIAGPLARRALIAAALARRALSAEPLARVFVEYPRHRVPAILHESPGTSSPGRVSPGAVVVSGVSWTERPG